MTYGYRSANKALQRKTAECGVRTHLKYGRKLKIWSKIRRSYFVERWLVPSAPAFDPQKSFLELTIVRLVILITVTLSGTMAAIISYSSNLQYEFSYLGWNNAVTVFKVPLGVLAFLIPLLALLAANHRSNQTKTQIEALEKQSQFSSKIAHQQTKSDEINQIFEGFEESWRIRSIVMYRSLFYTEAGRMEISWKTTSWITDAYLEAHEAALKSKSVSPAVFLKYLELLPLLETLGITFNPNDAFEKAATLHVETYIEPKNRTYRVPSPEIACIEICKIMGVLGRFLARERQNSSMSYTGALLTKLETLGPPHDYNSFKFPSFTELKGHI